MTKQLNTDAYQQIVHEHRQRTATIDALASIAQTFLRLQFRRDGRGDVGPTSRDEIGKFVTKSFKLINDSLPVEVDPAGLQHEAFIELCRRYNLLIATDGVLS